MEAIEIATPPIPEGEEWSTIEKLNKERELVGIYISAHPLDEYSVVLRGLCNTTCQELNDRNELAKKEEVRAGGIVTAVKERFDKTGKKFGIVTIEDFDNSGELAVFAEEWARWQGMLSVGCTVFMRLKCTENPYNHRLNLKIIDIQYLQTVKERGIERITICLRADKIDDTVVNDLTTLITPALVKPKRNEPSTQIYIQIVDPETNRPITLHSRGLAINIQRDLIQYIEGRDDMTYRIN